jgi:hypothetical protein
VKGSVVACKREEVCEVTLREGCLHSRRHNCRAWRSIDVVMAECDDLPLELVKQTETETKVGHETHDWHFETEP